MENPFEMDDLGVPLFLETPICFSWRYSCGLSNLSLSSSLRQTVKLHLEDIRTIFDLHLGKRVRFFWVPKWVQKLGENSLFQPLEINLRMVQEIRRQLFGLAIFVNPRGPYFLVGKWISYEVVQDSSLIKSSVQKRMSPRRLVSFGAFTTVDEILSAWSHQELFGSMANAKYLMLSSERNVKRRLEIRFSKTSEEHLQIWSDEIVDLWFMYSICTHTAYLHDMLFVVMIWYIESMIKKFGCQAFRIAEILTWNLAWITEQSLRRLNILGKTTAASRKAHTHRGRESDYFLASCTNS